MELGGVGAAQDAWNSEGKGAVHAEHSLGEKTLLPTPAQLWVSEEVQGNELQESELYVQGFILFIQLPGTPPAKFSCPQSPGW